MEYFNLLNWAFHVQIDLDNFKLVKRNLVMEFISFKFLKVELLNMVKIYE
jgi:hypothetical protein